jgi:hypothetical protein
MRFLRFVLTIRTEVTDRMLIFGQRHFSALVFTVTAAHRERGSETLMSSALTLVALTRPRRQPPRPAQLRHHGLPGDGSHGTRCDRRDSTDVRYQLFGAVGASHRPPAQVSG